jgi:hypothetical protein
MEVSGQLHAPATLLPGKDPLPLPIGDEAGWAPEQVWTWCGREIPSPRRKSNHDQVSSNRDEKYMNAEEV